MTRQQPIAQLNWVDLESSNVGQAAFDDKTNTIMVKFHGGGLYSYIGGSEEIYMSFIHAQSVGEYLHRVLKTLPYTRWESEEALLHHLNV